eukprot:Gb_27151 [translate_table: standard]
MGTLQKLAHDSSMSMKTSTASNYGPKSDEFPAGLRVLVVDDDPTCLKILEKMLSKCLYQVKTCCRATAALSMLRERKGGFDLVISDVYMPDMDGFKLLEQVGLEMDLPVIMMSADGGTRTVMKGIKHGACDYLIKPVRLEELKNIWQHVIRKKRNESKEFEHSGNVEDNERHKKGFDDVEYASSVNEGTDGNWRLPKKRKEAKEEDDDGEQDNEDPSASKKPRVVWSVELHQQFVSAVNQLGIDKAVPKRILELMSVQGLTRENVASHLQKYRLYLKRLSGVAQQQSGMNSSLGGTTETGVGSMGLLGRLDLQRLGQISPQALGTLPAELIGRVNASNGLGMQGVDQALLVQAAFQGGNCNPVNRVRYGQPLINSHANILQGLPSGLELKQFTQPQQHIPPFGNVGSSVDDTSSGFPMLQQQLSTTAGIGSAQQINGINNNGALNPQNNAMMVQLIQQQQQQVHQQQQQMHASATQQKQPGGQLHGIQLQNGQVLNLPSASLGGAQVLPNDIRGRVNPLSSIGNSSTGICNSIAGASTSGQLNDITPSPYGLIVPESNASVGIGQVSTVDYKNQNVPIPQESQYAIPNSVCVSTPLTSIGTEGEMSILGIKRLGGMNDIVNSPTLSVPSVSFGNSSSLGQNLNRSGRPGWQVQHPSMNHNLNQTTSPVSSPRHIQPSFGTQGLSAPSIQDQGQVKNFGFFGKGLRLPGRVVSNAPCPRIVNNAQSQSDLFVTDSGMRLKYEGASDFVANSKNENGLPSEHFSPDDLMNFLFKQQQEGLGLAEGEFSLDGYQLDNIHVN